MSSVESWRLGSEEMDSLEDLVLRRIYDDYDPSRICSVEAEVSRFVPELDRVLHRL
jgi:hypothetical protein